MKLTFGRITLALSNQCPNARVHLKCPAHHVTDIEIMPATIVHDVLDTLGKYGFGGTIAWHCYNEPMADPRLLSFVEYARARLPDADILIWSSAWYLTEEIANEFTAAGVTRWCITAYSLAEHERTTALATQRTEEWRIFYGVTKKGSIRLDDRMTMGPPVFVQERQSCNAPLHDLMIWPTGDVGLCCYDWNRTEVFGNIRELAFERYMEQNADALTKVQTALRRKAHPFDICKQCRLSR